MRARMSLESRRELLASQWSRYRHASRREKAMILDEFCHGTGYNRDYAVTLLNRPLPQRSTKAVPRKRKRTYTAETQRALEQLWKVSGGLCGKRLVAGIPDYVEALERSAVWFYSEATRKQVLRVSAATADRLLAPARRGQQPVGLSTTRPGSLLKHHIPIRTFADWNEDTAGFTEADLVAHCGETVAGEYINTLNLTDIKTGWTEPVALPNKGQEAVSCAIEKVRKRLPFALLGLDTDNGREFINDTLLRYCEKETITFSRGRPYKKNDQCFVEQKNFSVIRKAIGYNRLEGDACCHILNRYYELLRLYVNFFQPSMKLVRKARTGSKVEKRYDKPRTPYRRVLDCPEVPQWLKDKTNQFERLNPIDLQEQMERLKTELRKTAKLRFENEATITAHLDS